MVASIIKIIISRNTICDNLVGFQNRVTNDIILELMNFNIQ